MALASPLVWILEEDDGTDSHDNGAGHSSPKSNFAVAVEFFMVCNDVHWGLDSPGYCFSHGRHDVCFHSFAGSADGADKGF